MFKYPDIRGPCSPLVEGTVDMEELMILVRPKGFVLQVPYTA